MAEAARVAWADSESFTYDNEGQLTGVGSDTQYRHDSLANPLNAKETTYTYQYNGNILAKSEDNGAVSLVYQYNDPAHAHAVSAVVSGGQTFAYAYDANGNLTSGRDFTDAVAVASRAITYNPDGLPSRIVHNTGSSPLTTDFAYDGDGFRVKKTAGNRFTLYAGDYFEKSEAGASKFLFANGSRIAKIDSSGAYYFHQDHLGSTTVVSNATGNAVAGESAEYKPFGGFRVALDSTVTNYRFTDQEFDPESNLYYDARYYDPIIGRFVSADTVIPDYTDPQSLNRYSYVKNNPLMYVDPTGHAGVELFGMSFSFSDFRDWLSSPAPSSRETYISNAYFQNNSVMGALTLSEANNHWREGGGSSLIVNVGTLGLSNVSQLPPSGQVSFAGKNFSNVNDALVYGTVTLKAGPNNTVTGGFDYYNFDTKPWSIQTFVRNIETIAGRIYAGPGTPFRIEFTGTAPLGKKQ